MIPRLAMACLALCSFQLVQGKVIINEVFYHAPDNLDRLEWIELTNTGDQSIDISGWSLSQGVDYKIPAETILEAQEYLVICQDVELFREFHNVPAIGGFSQSLSNEGETIELRDATDGIVDSVTYADRAPWPLAADGYGASLERITPTEPSTPQNWSSSDLSAPAHLPGGSPGKRNNRYAKQSLPRISSVVVSPTEPAPGDAVNVSCNVTSDRAVSHVHAIYRTVKSGMASEDHLIPMSKADDGRYQAVVPGQETGTLVRISVRAVDEDGNTRFRPSPHGMRPAVSLYVMGDPTPSTIPLAMMIDADPDLAAESKNVWQNSGQGMAARMAGASVQQTLDPILDLGSAWTRLTVDQQPSHQTYLLLREVFQKQAPKRQAIIDQVLNSGDLQAGLREVPALASNAKAELDEDLKGVLTEAAHADYASASAKPTQPGPEQYVIQMLQIERLWLAIGTEFACTEQQCEELWEAVRQVREDRKKLIPLLLQLMTGKGDFEDMQTQIGSLESAMWQKLESTLSFRQRRFARQWYAEHGSMMGLGSSPVSSRPARGNSAFVYVDATTGKRQVFDFINISPRSAGYKVRFHKDRPLNGMTTVNVLFEVNERFVLAEPLAFDLYRRVGCPACLTDFVRLQVNDDLVGYYMLCEQPNRTFLRRNGLDDKGNLYKLVWYGNGIEGKHEKKTNVDGGHDDLVEVIEELAAVGDEDEWNIIQKRFNVDELINYFAVNMCLSHWDGFFNNFYAYHDVKGTGKWEMYPWDQDKTWGFHDGVGENEVFTDLPLTFGMEGDVPPGGGNPQALGNSWWRPGGYFSKPLLANPEFRQRFLARLKTILHETYTEEHYFPVIDELAERLRPEIPIRANAMGQDVDQAVARFERNIGLLKEHLTKRRAFLLEQDEVQAAQP